MSQVRAFPASVLAKASVLALALALGSWVTACASRDAGPREPRYNIIRNEQGPPPSGGIPPDKEAEIQLVLQQREVSTRKCYQDILNERQDRNFQGTVKVLIAISPGGQATDVRVVGGTLGDREVEACLVETIRAFEFPQVAQAGEVQYEFRFRPAY
jgi:TonB family protein